MQLIAFALMLQYCVHHKTHNTALNGIYFHQGPPNARHGAHSFSHKARTYRAMSGTRLMSAAGALTPGFVIADMSIAGGASVS